ncbi:hypothetical protein PS627_01212 [Pseudomonas fluorescens]|uniref:hypothetical protein n=1 Tax=Pseudomonas fluorescens TaxID=294 RepID=UPI0012550AA4|nr:hypothetical protein [Pseudomonas fluorescens]CAG8865313.1 hypothetical protein PS627_01212 [Pseudomonas fluorescens]
MPHQRSLKIDLKPAQLIACVAVGLWLGAVAIALGLWLAWHLWPEQVRPVAQAVVPALSTPAPAPDAQAQMFERYKAILQQQEQQQARDTVQGRPRNLNNPTCQFWLQQDRTAPSEKSQANVMEHCYRP